MRIGLIFDTAYVALATNALLTLACSPLVVLLLTTDPQRSWPLLALLAPLAGPALCGVFAVLSAHTTGLGGAGTVGRDAAGTIDRDAAETLGRGAADSLGRDAAGMVGRGAADSLGRGAAGAVGRDVADSLGRGAAGAVGRDAADSLGRGAAGAVRRDAAESFGRGAAGAVWRGAAGTAGRGATEAVERGGAETVGRDVAVVRTFLRVWRASARRSMTLTAGASALLVVLAVDCRAAWGHPIGALAIPVLVVAMTLVVATTMLALVALAERPAARVRDACRVSVYLAVRHWYLTVPSLAVLAIFEALLATRPAIALGLAAAPLLYVVWAGSRFSLNPVLHPQPLTRGHV